MPTPVTAYVPYRCAPRHAKEANAHPNLNPNPNPNPNPKQEEEELVVQEEMQEAACTWVMCDRCEKWRRLRGVSSAQLPEQWRCEMNDDVRRGA